MENSNYNSLAQNLIEQGILQSESKLQKTDELKDLYGIVPDEDMNNSPFIEKPITEEKTSKKKQKKRINQYDLELLSNSEEEVLNTSSFKTIKRFIDFKQKLASRKAFWNIENFLFTFFPKLYKIKLAKDAMSKLAELNIDTKKLLEKTVPYGESEARYENLIKYIVYANEIQVKLKKKID